MKNNIFFILSLSVSMAACSKSEDIVLNEIADDSIIKVVEFRTQELEKDFETTRGLTYTGSGVPFAWTLDDVVGIFPDRGDQISFAMTEGAGTTAALLDGGAWALKPDAKYAAYYPFDKANFFTDRNNIIFDYNGQEEIGIANADHLSKYDFQAASFTKSVNGKLSFELKRLNCILILRLTVPQAGTYTDLYITAEDKVFTTKTKLSLGDNISTSPVEKNTIMHLSLKDVTTTTENQVADFLIMLAPVDLTGQTYEVTLKSANGYLYKGTKTPSSAYSANKITRTSISLRLDTSSNIGFGGEFSTDETTL